MSTSTSATLIDDDGLIDAGMDDGPISPRTIAERIQLAIHWTLGHQEASDATYDELPADFVQQLDHVGLKLVQTDGSDISPVRYPDGSPSPRRR